MEHCWFSIFNSIVGSDSLSQICCIINRVFALAGMFMGVQISRHQTVASVSHRDRDIRIWMFVWGKGWKHNCVSVWRLLTHIHLYIHMLLLPTDKPPSFSHLRLVYVLCFFSSSRFGSRATAQRGLSAHSSSSVFLLNNPPQPSPPLLSDSLIQLWAASSARRIIIIAS